MLRCAAFVVPMLVAVCVGPPASAQTGGLPDACAIRVLTAWAVQGEPIAVDLVSGSTRRQVTVNVTVDGFDIDATPSTASSVLGCEVDEVTLLELTASSGASSSRAAWLALVGSFGILGLAIFVVAVSGHGVGPRPTLAREDAPAPETAEH